MSCMTSTKFYVKLLRASGLLVVLNSMDISRAYRGDFPQWQLRGPSATRRAIRMIS